MTNTFSFQTYEAVSFFDLLAEHLSSYMSEPSAASKGEICGFLLETCIREGKGSSSFQYPVETFLISSGDGGVTEQHFDRLPAETQTKAALLAMRVGILRFLQMSDLRGAFLHITDDIDTLYARCWILPNVALIHEECYEDRLEEFSAVSHEETQDDIDRYFVAVRRKHLSHHAALEKFTRENHELELLCDISPVKDDFADPNEPRLQITFRKETCRS